MDTKTLFSLIALLLFQVTFSQDQEASAERLFSKADSLYHVHDYKNAGSFYAAGQRLLNEKASAGRYWYAASAWALADMKDSALWALRQIALSESTTMADYKGILGDKDLKVLHNEPGWKDILTQIQKQGSKKEIDILFGKKIRLRDGVQLNSIIYKPRIQEGPLPVIFSLTPYSSDELHPRGVYFAKHAYVYVIVEARGRGSSEGDFEPMRNEGRDGYDIVAWLAKQPFCNGKVTMWGGSYLGMDQWFIAKELPPALNTIVPVAAPMPGVDAPPLEPYYARWLMFTAGKTHNLNLMQDVPYWDSKYQELYDKDLPFAALDSLVGYPNPFWKRLMRLKQSDPYYTSMNPSPKQYRNLKIPILTITGAYDANQQGALAYYKCHMKYGSIEAKAQHFLIIGPWDHAGTRNPPSYPGGEASVLDMNRLHLEWYDYTLKGGKRPSFLKDKVMYYVTGEESWRSAPSLDDIGKETVKFYLTAMHSLNNDNTDSAILQSELSSSSVPSTYTYDPLDDSKSKRIVYNSAPFNKKIIIAGFFKMDASIETNVRDIDFQVFIFEVKQNGERHYLTGQRLRARNRNGFDKEELLVPGQVYKYHFDKFPFIAHTIEKGSHLQLVLFSPNDGQKNFCSGKNVAYETSKDAHTAVVRLYQSSKAPSTLFVPKIE